MPSIYNSMAYFKEYHPEQIYFVFDMIKPIYTDPALHYVVYHGNPKEENREWQLVTMNLGMTLENATQLCKELNEYPYTLKEGDRVVIQSKWSGMDEYNGWVVTVKLIQFNGTIVVESDPAPEDGVEFVTYFYATELVPCENFRQPTDEERYFSQFV